MTINVRFQIAGHTAAAWTTGNPVLLDRELAFETDTKRAKIGDGSTAWNALTYFLGTVASKGLDTDGTLAANSDDLVASQKAVRTFVSAAVTGALKFIGATNCSTNPNYPAATKGDSYVVSVGGRIGGGAGPLVDAGDMFLAIADNAGGTHAAVGASWIILEHNLSGVLLAANALSELAGVAATARANLGLGSAATQNTGTSGATIPLLNGTNSWSANQSVAGLVTTSGASAGIAYATRDSGVTVTLFNSGGNLYLSNPTNGNVGYFSLNGSYTTATGSLTAPAMYPGALYFQTPGAGGVMGLLMGSPLTANRNLTIITGDASRSLDISAANVTISGVGATLLSQTTQALMRSTGLGLGSAATQNTGTSGATIPLLNVANTWSSVQTFSGGTLSNLYEMFGVGNGYSISYASGAISFNSAGSMDWKLSGTVMIQMNSANGFYPGSDDSVTLGNIGFRWSNSYAKQFRPGSGLPIWTSGAGTPEGAVTAGIGSLYTRTDGGAGTTLYVKESGTGNTGWVAK